MMHAEARPWHRNGAVWRVRVSDDDGLLEVVLSNVLGKEAAEAAALARVRPRVHLDIRRESLGVIEVPPEVDDDGKVVRESFKARGYKLTAKLPCCAASVESRAIVPVEIPTECDKAELAAHAESMNLYARRPCTEYMP